MTANSSAPRRNILKVVLAGGLGLASFWVGSALTGSVPDDEVVAPAERARRPQSTQTTVAFIPDSGPKADPSGQRLAPDVLRNPFGSLNLRPPGGPAPAAVQPKAVEAKPVEPPPAPPPSAPPLPFTALGSIEGSEVTSGERLAFLQQQGALLIVRKGDAIGQLYRVDSVSPDKVELTYLPLNQRQWLNLAP